MFTSQLFDTFLEQLLMACCHFSSKLFVTFYSLLLVACHFTSQLFDMFPSLLLVACHFTSQLFVTFPSLLLVACHFTSQLFVTFPSLLLVAGHVHLTAPCHVRCPAPRGLLSRQLTVPRHIPLTASSSSKYVHSQHFFCGHN